MRLLHVAMENQRFAAARALSGHGGLRTLEVCDLLRDVPFPESFRHLRCMDLATGLEGGRIFLINRSLPDVPTVAILAIVEPELEAIGKVKTGDWVETVALPLRDKGGLELGFWYVLRE